MLEDEVLDYQLQVINDIDLQKMVEKYAINEQFEENNYLDYIVEEVQDERTVHLVYAHPGKSTYLDVWGRATIVTNRQQIVDKWSPIVKAWFPDGITDPNLILLKVQPYEVYYWEAESGKMVQFFKMAASIVTGKRLAEGAEGSLNI